ncbi:CD225/dispanin family protein [Antrihabitans stalactiti]|uniref:CD225/dispanin family protein n=1 Tax=Antrihabitans stalactiti TaxID=2584121 RepID=A0A848KNW8_9NOCA|nr:CD225/dispanin family protein [Antrihabitans stalactiti]NMN98634.1 CD225/dispanin family protein [Antrihabitans stalactiti]
MTTPSSPTNQPPDEHNRPVAAGIEKTSVQPPSNAGWAVAAALFFWPLSFSAFTHAFNVYPLWASGDIQGAREASDRVRRLGQLSLWIAGALLLLLLVVYTIVAVILIAQGDFETGRHGMEHDGFAR